MSEIQPKDLFSGTFIQETTKLRYERVLHKPKTQCTRCGAELILSRLPWQSRSQTALEPSPQNGVLSAGSGAVCTSETGTSVLSGVQLRAFHLLTLSIRLRPQHLQWCLAHLLRSSLRMALRVMLRNLLRKRLQRRLGGPLRPRLRHLPDAVQLS